MLEAGCIMGGTAKSGRFPITATGIVQKKELYTRYRYINFLRPTLETFTKFDYFYFLIIAW